MPTSIRQRRITHAWPSSVTRPSRWWPIRGRARRLPPPPPPDEMLVIEDRLRRNVEDVLSIRDRQIRGGIVVFRGSLTTDPARALDLLIARFRPFGYTPYLREEA